MSDELDELRQSDQLTPEALAHVVAMDRQDLMDLLDADSLEQPRLHVVGGRSRRPTKRVGYIGAITAAAAAAFIGVVLVGGEDPLPELDAVEVAEENTEPVPDTEAPTDSTSSVPQLTVTDDSTSDESSLAPDREATPALEPEPTTSTSTTPEAEIQAPAPTMVPTIDGPFDQSVDLLSLHYDYAHLDDGHASVAALEIVTSFGFQPHVVAGTYESGYDDYVHDFAPVMQATWGDEWINALVDRPSAVRRSVERWLTTLDAGGRVWVAEGGVADFTADVVREIQLQRPNLDSRAAIHVVQHNSRNESESTPENLAFLTANVSYERIDDGNATNDTANLNMRNGEFEATALAGRHSASWSTAFELLPANKLDFSDTVEVLHILDVGTDEVADPGDFANRFISPAP